MKIRNGFVSNSSSSSFSVHNKTDQDLTVEDLIRENFWMFYAYVNECGGSLCKPLDDIDGLLEKIPWKFDIIPANGELEVICSNEVNDVEGALRFEMGGRLTESKRFSWKLTWNSQVEQA